MVVEVGPEHAAVQAQGERQAPDQRQAALRKQQPIKVVANREHGGTRPRVVRVSGRVEPARLERQCPHPEVDGEVALRRHPAGRDPTRREDRRDPEVQGPLTALDRDGVAPEAKSPPSTSCAAISAPSVSRVQVRLGRYTSASRVLSCERESYVNVPETERSVPSRIVGFARWTSRVAKTA